MFCLQNLSSFHLTLFKGSLILPLPYIILHWRGSWLTMSHGSLLILFTCVLYMEKSSVTVPPRYLAGGAVGVWGKGFYSLTATLLCAKLDLIWVWLYLWCVLSPDIVLCSESILCCCLLYSSIFPAKHVWLWEKVGCWLGFHLLSEVWPILLL